MKERVNKLTYPGHSPTLLANAAHNERQCHALVMDNRTENHNKLEIL